MELHIPPACGNAPKKALVRDLTVLFASYQVPEAMAHLADDVVWTLVGDKPVHGREAFARELEAMSGNKAVALTIHAILTHGTEAAVHGEMHMADGHRFGFADFYTFTSAKGDRVQSITSYVIKL